jgi:predicted Rossmann fold flavoprotein
MKIAVIGAGASGILAALNAARQGASVTLFERNESIGRKLLVTGSGRCNLTNDGVSAARYSSDHPSWLQALIQSCSVEQLLETFNALGIPTYKTWDGWYYPLSNSAHSVVDALNHAVGSTGIQTRFASQVINIAQKGDHFDLLYLRNTEQHTESFKKVIVSSGGKAYPTLGSKGELFPVLSRMDHTVLPIQPALAPILADLNGLKSLQGVRLDLGVRLYDKETLLASSAGNMIFTKYGMNGPAVMDISHHIPHPTNQSTSIALNLLYFYETEFDRLLNQKRNTPFPLSLLLGAFFPPKVVYCYAKLLGLPHHIPLAELDTQTVHRIIKQLKDTRLKILGVRGFEFCQASTGGVPVAEVEPQTLESKIQPGLFLTGETLNVVGPCGGYNLHFAFASGMLAGRAAGNNN